MGNIIDLFINKDKPPPDVMEYNIVYFGENYAGSSFFGNGNDCIGCFFVFSESS